jgi:ribosomal protein S18 acetylase RimI-like enzyme
MSSNIEPQESLIATGMKFPRQLPSRTVDYLQWRASNICERLWKRSHKVPYHQELTYVDREGVDPHDGAEVATVSDLSDLPGPHDTETYRKRLAGDHELLIIRDGEIVVGYLWISFTTVRIKEVGASIDFDDDGYISHVHIIDSHRGQGLGTKLIHKAVNVARKRDGCDTVFCLTEWSNLGMRKVLEKTGFHPPEHLSYAKTGPFRRWTVHDKDVGPFVTLLHGNIGRDIID